MVRCSQEISESAGRRVYQWRWRTVNHAGGGVARIALEARSAKYTSLRTTCKSTYEQRTIVHRVPKALYEEPPAATTHGFAEFLFARTAKTQFCWKRREIMHPLPQGVMSSMKIIQSRVPIIKAQATGGCGSDENFNFNIDISVDGPTHSGLATSAFTSYLSDHLPNLAPLTIVVKSLLQVCFNFCFRTLVVCCLAPTCPTRPLMLKRSTQGSPLAPNRCQNKGLNDVWTGGISGYGLVLMVAFALLQRDHFPPSPAGSSFIQQSNITPTERQADVEQRDDTCPRKLSSKEGPDRNDFAVPPSPGQADNLPPSFQRGPTRRKVGPSGGRQRFWQRSSLSGDRSNSTGVMLATKERKEAQKSGGKGSASSWDRYGRQATACVSRGSCASDLT